MQDAVEVGDEIITAGGIHGTVTELDDQTAQGGDRARRRRHLDRRAIAAVATEIEVEPEEDGEDQPAPGTDAEPR